MSYILEISYGCPNDKYPNNGIFQFDQAKALKDIGQNVIFAAIDVRSIKRWRKWGISKQLIKQMPVYEINLPIGPIPLKLRVHIEAWALQKLYKRIEKDKGMPEVLHAHFGITAYSAAKLKGKINIPLVITEHSSGINSDQIDKNTYDVYSQAYKRADRIIAVSNPLCKNIKNNFGVEASVIPNIADTSIFNYQSNLNDHSSNICKIVSVGSLELRKGFDLLIKAASNVKNTNFCLDIYGEGPQKQELQEMINDYKLNRHIHLKGFAKREILAQAFSTSNFFVLSSRVETFGVVYIEAMATGLPVIATNCGGPEDFVNASNGILIDTDNVEQLTKALEKMIDNNQNYDRVMISNGVKEKFSADHIANKLLAVFKEVASNCIE